MQGRDGAEIQALHFGSVKVDSSIRYPSEDIKEMFRHRLALNAKFEARDMNLGITTIQMLYDDRMKVKKRAVSTERSNKG